MDSETAAEAPTAEVIRPSAIALTPKRRIKPDDNTAKIEIPVEISAPSSSARRMRMKRTGRMPLRFKGQDTPAVWISPEILSTADEAEEAPQKSARKKAARTKA